MKFKISGVGLDTKYVDYPTSFVLDKNTFPIFIKTDISDGREVNINASSDCSIMTSASFLGDIGKAVEGHLYFLKRKKIDLLLLPGNIQTNETSVEELRGLITDGLVDNIGLEQPGSIEEIKKFVEDTGIEVKYVALNICPVTFPWTIINYCRENGISIFGLNPFGGKLQSTSLIYSFSRPYLLNFIATWADVVIVSGGDPVNSWMNIEYLMTLVGKESSNKYVLEKDFYKLPVKIPPKIVKTSLIVTPDLILPLDNPNTIFSFEELNVTFKKVVTKLEEDDWNLPFIAEKIISYVNLNERPEDGKDKDFLAILRYTITVNVLDPVYDKVVWCKISDNIYKLICTKKTEKKFPWYKFKKPEIELVEDEFLVAVIDGQFKIYDYKNFQNKQTAEEEVQSPNIRETPEPKEKEIDSEGEGNNKI